MGHWLPRRLTAFASLLLGLSACSTPYGTMGLLGGGGVEHVQLAQDTFRVRARGNAYTSAARVEEFVLLRASEIALAQGYPHFAILETKDATRTEDVVLPGYTDTNTSGSVQRLGSASRMGGMSSNSSLSTEESTKRTTTLPAQAFAMQMPELQILVKLLKSPDGASGTLYDAALVKGSLAPKLM